MITYASALQKKRAEIKTSWNMGTHGDLDSSILAADFGAMFDVPISTESIVALRICSTSVKLP